ncbi:coiled-coil domain-containing protein mad1 [Rhizoclosmatium sp. JEL0117]|nr:coiled-coil domain-containing protein mad1 [Rhizoclosmatium sp. JEL0117]
MAPFSVTKAATAADVAATLDSFRDATNAVKAAAAPRLQQQHQELPLARPSSTATSKVQSIQDVELDSVDLFVDSDLVNAKRTIKLLERELLMQKDDSERRIIALELENARLKQNMQDSLSKIGKLERDCTFLLESNKKLEESQQLKDAEREQKDKESSSITTKLQSENASLTERLSVTNEQLRDLERRREHEIRSSKREADQYRQRLQALELQHEMAVAAKTAALKQTGDLQSQISSLESKLISLKHGNASSPDSFQTIKKQLEDQLAYIHTLETSNTHLKTESQRLRTAHQSSTAQEEKIRTLEIQVRAMDSLRTRLVEAEAEATTLKAEKRRWSSLLRESDLSSNGEVTPLGLARALETERLERAREMERVSEELADVKVLRAHVGELEVEIGELRKRLAEEEAKAEVQSRQVKRLEKGRDLVAGEVAFLREQLTAVRFQDVDADTGMNDKLLRDQISELEALIERYRTRVADLEVELQNASNMPSIPKVEAQSDFTAAKRKLEDKVKQLEKEVENFDNQIFVLERAIGQGAFDRDNLKVLQLAENPESKAFAIRKELLDTLQAENKALKARLLGSEFGGLVPVEVVKSIELESRRLQGLIDERDKRILRLREVFMDKSKEFKEAVFSLLGYRVEFQESLVRLISTYADPQDDSSFLFSSQENDNGTMQIVGGAPARVQELNQLRQHYVLEGGSVPAFLAFVTLKGWERHYGVEDMEQ